MTRDQFTLVAIPGTILVIDQTMSTVFDSWDLAEALPRYDLLPAWPPRAPLDSEGESEASSDWEWTPADD